MGLRDADGGTTRAPAPLYPSPNHFVLDVGSCRVYVVGMKSFSGWTALVSLTCCLASGCDSEHTAQTAADTDDVDDDRSSGLYENMCQGKVFRFTQRAGDAPRGIPYGRPEESEWHGIDLDSVNIPFTKFYVQHEGYWMTTASGSGIQAYVDVPANTSFNLNLYKYAASTDTWQKTSWTQNFMHTGSIYTYYNKNPFNKGDFFSVTLSVAKGGGDFTVCLLPVRVGNGWMLPK